MNISCPYCKKETVWKGNVFRPFCSERCRLIDLGNWFEERYSIVSEEEIGEEFLVEPSEK